MVNSRHCDTDQQSVVELSLGGRCDLCDLQVETLAGRTKPGPPREKALLLKEGPGEIDSLLKAVQTLDQNHSWLTHPFLLPKGQAVCLSRGVHP